MSSSFEARIVDASPHAASLIEGHRDFGYTLETALADVIDNSISAGATEISLLAETSSDQPWIAVSDDGTGMTEVELIEAMRLGSKSPSDQRSKMDLGRFGLGLKSASFSQCRNLTVTTRKSGVVACASWDLDEVKRRKSWALELHDKAEQFEAFDALPKSGTVVLWRKLDRLMGNTAGNNVQTSQHMNREISAAERHLCLVFHRYLEGPSPKIVLTLNGRRLEPIDPFASKNSACQPDRSEEIILSEGGVRIQSFTLPHHNMMSKQEWDEIGGPEGHLRSQGLYIYREGRLIIAGGWLGLAKQRELTKLCRIRVDIPNTMDSDWKIDVKKASAQLPLAVRTRLKLIVERLVGTSKRTYQSRGRRLVDDERFPIWNRIQSDGDVVFRPNLAHPVFAEFVDQLPSDLRAGFENCIRVVGSGLPIEALHAQMLGDAEAVVPDLADQPQVQQMVSAVVTRLLESGVKHEKVRDIMNSHDFFRKNWTAASKLIDELLEAQT